MTRAPFRRLAVAILLLLAPALAGAQGDAVRDSIAALRSAATAARSAADTSALAGVLEALGREHWRADRFDSALVHLLTSRDLYATRGDSAAVARVSNSIGSSHYQVGNYALALLAYVRSLDIREANGDILGQARVHANIAKAYEDWRQFDRALASADRGVAMAEQAGDGLVLGYALNTRADILLDLGRFAEAREACERSLAAYYSGTPPIAPTDSLSAWSLNIMLLGEIDLAEGRAEDALRRFRAVYDWARQGNSLRGQVHASVTAGRAHEALNDLRAAESAFLEALRGARTTGNRTYQLEAMAGLTRVAERQGRSAAALQYARAHEALRDSIFNEQTAQRVATIELEAEANRQRTAAQTLAREQLEQAAALRQQRVLTALAGLLFIVTLGFVAALWRANRTVREREAQLEARNQELQAALAEVQTLAGFIPICASCKNVRDDAGYWRSVEEYISSRSPAQFSHSICNTCGPKLYGADWEPHATPPEG